MVAKKRKPTAKPSAPRRTSRRGKKTDVDADGETSTATKPAPHEIFTDQESTLSETPTATSEESAAHDSQPSENAVTKSHPIPYVVLHKKFGKYRYLFNNEDNYSRKYEVGSDSENSSIEIRVVDPCASSESDSNNALDSQSDTNSGVCHSPLNSGINAMQCNSRNMSPIPLLNNAQHSSDLLGDNHIPVLNENIGNVTVDRSTATPIPIEFSEIQDKESVHDKVSQMESIGSNSVENIESITIETNAIENLPLNTIESTLEIANEEHEVNEDIPYEEHLDYEDDMEVITVVQIVEDDNQELYYNIKLDSPVDESKTQSDELENKAQDREFQKHFEKLNLSTKIGEGALPMDCTEQLYTRTPPCTTPDIPFLKETSTDILTRPDPSITPSSTLSDDSNSSRATEQNQINSNDSAESSPSGVRRSSRIKTISSLKQKTKGYGLVKTPLKKALITQTKLKLEELGSDSQEKPTDISNTMPNSPSFPMPCEMPVKVKSRWRRSSELEMGAHSPASSPLASPNLPPLQPASETQHFPDDHGVTPLSKVAYDKIIDERMSQYDHLNENVYLCERMISKETKKMICDCFLTKEEIERGELGCGEDCLNRLLMIECNSRCPVGDRCTNRRFQKVENSPLKVFYADKKGCGIEASVNIPSGEFLMEYVGEVLDYEQFYKRAQAYSDENNLHHYFMSLKGDTVIDATAKGNISRFINHSCEPNAETQKWTVNGELRIGFFSKRDIVAGEEITFDYQFKRFGKVAQRCYCGADNCRGWIGGEPDSDDEDDLIQEEDDVSTSKSDTTESAEPASDDVPAQRPRVRRPKRDRRLKSTPELVQDADIEDELEALNRTGIKNQSHTLSLSRTVVRAKTIHAQTALLRLLRDADLPCRRLFLDYRGLRLLAPWCNDAPLDFKLEMLQTVDRLPIPNKTMVQESRFFTIIERWLSTADTAVAEPVFINEATGLPVDAPNRPQELSPEKMKENAAMTEKVKELSKQMLERWSSLKEVFKIPKKERIQQMKEHERQANVERRAADSSGTRDRDRDRERRDERDRERREEREREKDREKERDREREKDRDRDRDRHRDRDRDRDKDDRDRRKRRSSPDGRRSIRLNDRVLTAVPPMSKEERRRAFAEAAAAADESRRQRDQQQWHPAHYWTHPDGYPQMFPPGMMPSGNMMQHGNMMPPGNMMQSMTGNIPGGLLPTNMPPGTMPPGIMTGMLPEIPPEWIAPNGEYQGPPGFCPPFSAQPFCMPQPSMMGMPGMSGMMGMGGYMFGQQMAAQVTAGPSLPSPFPTHPQPNADFAQPTLSKEEASKEALLPSLWRSAVDSRGRTYYYHVKLRIPQWQPPTPPPPPSPDKDESSSEEEEDEQMSALATAVVKRQGKLVEGVNGIYEVIKESTQNGLIPDHALLTVKSKKRRPGLVTERPISPRTAEDKLAGKMEIKRCKQAKEKLRRRRERIIQKVRILTAKQKKIPEVKPIDTESGSDSDVDSEETPEPTPPPPQPDPEEVAEAARKIKEHFRSSMARVIVHHLNPYRRRDAPIGRITSTEDFKHLARKLTHFVMLKELKHCRSVEELVVTASVRSKAKEFVKKYMAKFGSVYRRPAEEAD